MFADDPELVAKQREQDETLDHDNPLEEVFEDQLACADMVIVSKADLMEGNALSAVIELIDNSARDAVEAVPAVHGRLDPELVLGLTSAAEDEIDDRWSHHDDLDGEHDHDDFETFIVDITAAETPKELADRVTKALSLKGVLRVKGVIEVTGNPSRLVVQGVGERVEHYYDRPWNDGEDRRSRLVIIGLNGLEQGKIETLLRPV